MTEETAFHQSLREFVIQAKHDGVSLWDIHAALGAMHSEAYHQAEAEDFWEMVDSLTVADFPLEVVEGPGQVAPWCVVPQRYLQEFERAHPIERYLFVDRFPYEASAKECAAFVTAEYAKRAAQQEATP